MTILYRYVDEVTFVDALGVPEITIRAHEYKAIKETLHGYWIKDDSRERKSNQRWISKEGRKRFAYLDKQLALESFIRRKQVQISIIKYQFKNAESALKQAKELKTKENGGV